MSGYLLGVDAGQTVTKAALFDTAGRELAVASAYTRATSPRPRWQERDLDEAWRQTAAAIRDCVTRAGVDPGDVLGVGVCGHNDGVHLVDGRHRPVRPAILATDSRAYAEADRYRAEVGTALLARTGQVPVAYSPAAILAWLRTHEPEALDRARWFLFCKDWLRLKLTGQVATDPSEASAFCTDVHTQTWSAEVLDLFGLGDLARLLPPLVDSAARAGEVTAEAAGQTGLRARAPGVTGAHDVDAAALGIGAAEAGALSLVLGTFSINQVVATAPVADPRWQARTFLRPGQWLHMSTSPAGASNLDWAVRLLGPADGDPRYPEAIAEAGPDLAAPAPLYLPYLYGSPHGAGLAASLVGVRGWHTRGDLLRGVLQGIVFNHRWHVAALGEAFAIGTARLCGGGARSAPWCQLLADTLGIPVEVTDATEAGGRGAALLAGVGAKVYRDLDDAVATAVRVVRRYDPAPDAAAELATRYARWLAVVTALEATT